MFYSNVERLIFTYEKVDFYNIISCDAYCLFG